MSEEQRQRQMDFILEQQAQLTATVSKLSDTVSKLSDKVERTADSITALLAIAEIQSGEIKELGASVRAINERQRESEERRRESEERRREGDERLNALINTVERFIEGRTGQGGDGR